MKCKQQYGTTKNLFQKKTILYEKIFSSYSQLSAVVVMAFISRVILYILVRIFLRQICNRWLFLPLKIGIFKMLNLFLPYLVTALWFY